MRDREEVKKTEVSERAERPGDDPRIRKPNPAGGFHESGQHDGAGRQAGIVGREDDRGRVVPVPLSIQNDRRSVPVAAAGRFARTDGAAAPGRGGLVQREGAGRSGVPRVTIGLPVRNGENYLRDAIESILAQSFTDFRLIIADNASDDSTEAICRGYVARDPRVSYHRHESNIGAAPNFNWIFGLNTSEYFKWAAHDDILGPDFLKVCVERLDREPDLALCHTLSVKIDGSRRVCGTYDDQLPLDGKRPRDRFRSILWVDHFTEIWGVMRASDLRKTRLYGSYIGSDRTLLAELLLTGAIAYVPGYHFFRRDHDGCYCRSKQSAAERLRWFDPAKTHPVLNDGPAKLMAYLRAIRTHPMPMLDRAACVADLAKWAGRRALDRARVVRPYRAKLSAPAARGGEIPVPPAWLSVAESSVAPAVNGSAAV